jgi:uncharacterized membrane protein
MSSTGDPLESMQGEQARRSSLMHRLRNYFLTGLVVAAPLFITIYIIWGFVQWIDGLVVPLIPSIYRLDRYLPFPVPGFGLVVALVFITLLGFLTANLVGRRLVALGESLLGRMPLVRNLYGGLKQIFETVISRRAKAFQRVALLEFPRKDLWSLVFIATETRGEVNRRLGAPEDEIITVFMPTTPNPTTGFLMFAKRRELVMLDMTVEAAAKMVISGGLVVPEFEGEGEGQQPTGERPRGPRRVKRFTPPSAA